VNPFVAFRWKLDSYAEAQSLGWSDADFVSLVERLDEAIVQVDGRGFRFTPLDSAPDLAEAIGLGGNLWVKNDTVNVGGSHKARHLFGVMLHLALAETQDAELAIASCGNAAVAAGVVAAARGWPLRVFIPTWADEAVVDRLLALGARIEVCERRPGERGDPTYLRFVEAIEAGSVPFSVQGTVTPSTIDGGRTIGWEAASQLAEMGVTGRLRIFVQIGGGALASAAWLGMAEGIAPPVLHPVQTESCAPFVRAWDRLSAEVGGGRKLARHQRARAMQDPETVREAMELARSHPERYMWPWEEVGQSLSSGILDDVTYDWLGVMEPVLVSGGWPVLVSEHQIASAWQIGVERTGIDADATGTAGLAGLLDEETRDQIGEDQVLVFFTGVRRQGADG